MPFKKGQPRPSGAGRKPNGQSPNKTTAQTQMVLSGEIIDYINSGRFKEDLDAIETPKDRLLVIEKYASYVMPKRQAVDGNMNINTAQSNISDTLSALAEENEN